VDQQVKSGLPELTQAVQWNAKSGGKKLFLRKDPVSSSDENRGQLQSCEVFPFILLVDQQADRSYQNESEEVLCSE